MRRLAQYLGRLTAALLLLVGLLVVAGVPATPAADEAPPATETAPTETFPGLQDVVPMASQVADDLTRVASAISGNVDIKGLTAQADKLEREWLKFNEQVKSYGELTTWPVNRLLQAQTQLEQHNSDFADMLNRIGEPLSAFEDLRGIWSARRLFWDNWKKSLLASGAKIPSASFRKVDQQIGDGLGRLDAITSQLVELQQRVSKERDGILALREQLDSELTSLRRDPFKRNANPLLSADFFHQFDNALQKRFRDGLQATFQFQGDFVSRQGWLLALQGGLVLVLFLLFRYLEKVTADRTDEWHFVFSRPVAAAFFIASTIPQLFYVAPPALLQLLMTALAVASAARLSAALIEDRHKRHYVYILAAVYILTGALTVTGMPLPYYRLYLTGLCLIGIPSLLFAARRQIFGRRKNGKVAAAMLLGSLLLLIVLSAQMAGYVTFALHLLDATFGSILVIFLAVMMLQIGEGGIEFIFTLEYVGNRQFVKQLGNEAPQRFMTLLRIGIAVAALNYVLEVWGIGKGSGSVWSAILDFRVSVGEFSLSVQMVLLVAVVLYLTILVSWFLQALLESQLFYNTRVDRGVRDAVKKLSHYALILIGFLVAMSMAGIDLKNFTILAGAFGIGLGFGLQDIVNNFVSGLILLFERPVKVGDTVIVGDSWGTIKNIGMRSTVVETLDLSEIIVPNSQMISEKVTNWTLSSNITRLVIPIGVKYGSDMKLVLHLLEQVAIDHPDVVETPPPSAIFTEFGDSSLNFELRVWISDVGIRFRVRSQLGVAIAEALHAADIEIPFPQRDLHLRSVEPGLIDTARRAKPAAKKPAPRKKATPAKSDDQK